MSNRKRKGRKRRQKDLDHFPLEFFDEIEILQKYRYSPTRMAALIGAEHLDGHTDSNLGVFVTSMDKIIDALELRNQALRNKMISKEEIERLRELGEQMKEAEALSRLRDENGEGATDPNSE